MTIFLLFVSMVLGLASLLFAAIYSVDRGKNNTADLFCLGAALALLFMALALARVA